jgi:hypothetical protein
MTRLKEYNVFQQGQYPLPGLAHVQATKDSPYSVYPPYAFPIFALFFAWGGAAQGWFMVHCLSLFSLVLIAWIGWRSLRFAGPAAGLLGALAPVAISGNSYSIYMGQFSILCMGLVSLQWLLVKRHQPWLAGLCWALAMLKPQIALGFVVPLLRQGYRRGLLLGLAILLLLSAGALAFTHVSPWKFLAFWLVPNRLGFVQAGTFNLMRWLGLGLTAVLVAIVSLLVLIFCVGNSRSFAKTFPLRTSIWSRSLSDFDAKPTLKLQGLCAVIGALVFYHHPYDNIMLYPALLAIFAQALELRSLWSRLVAVAMAMALWAPVHLTANTSLFQVLNAGVWLLVGLTLLLHRPGGWGFREKPPQQVSALPLQR